MQEIGRILLVQVQRSTLKPGKRLATYYDPTPILVVESLRLTPQGVIGITGDGTEVMDLHHIEHLTSHNIRGVNGISFGFSSHYQSMREAYGDHIVNGCAGENVLIEANKVLQRQDLGSRLAIRVEKTGQFIYLSKLKVAAPCIEFSQYAANHGQPMPPAQLKTALQFLDDGMRGFYATVEDQPDEMIIQAGDRAFVG
jgi:hypothetical protein